MARNYRKEYDNYQGKPEQKKRRASRNAANRAAKRKGKISKGDGKDVHHKDGNPRNNKVQNISVTPKSVNRSFARTKTARKK